MTNPIVTSFWDKATGSWQYVFHDPVTMKGAIVDPVLDFDPLSGAVSTDNAQRILDHVREVGIRVEWVLDTHPHADHFSAAPWLAARLTGARTGIGCRVVGVQQLWKEIYHLGDDLPEDGSQWDRLFSDGDEFMVGEVPVRVLFCPGHTLASVTYVAGDAAFVHDTLMMPDSGTARADFPGGSSQDLFHSIQRILSLPEKTRIFVGHDYAPNGRDPLCEATVADHLASNLHVATGTTEETFCKMRDARDATLPLPRLMLAALQINIRGGRVPDPEENGYSYLKIPLCRFTPR